MKSNKDQSIAQRCVIERKMFKAENNSRMPTGGELNAWFRLLVKFASPVTF